MMPHVVIRPLSKHNYATKITITAITSIETINCHPGNTLAVHYSDVMMSAMASQITILTIVCSTIYSGADRRKHQSSTSQPFVRRIHRWPVISPHKGPVTRKRFPFDDVIIYHLKGFREAISMFWITGPYGVANNTIWSLGGRNSRMAKNEHLGGIILCMFRKFR